MAKANNETTLNDLIGLALVALVLISILGTIGYLAYVEYSLEKYWSGEIKEHNGTCKTIDKLGLVEQCSFKTVDSYMTSSSSSQCFVNDNPFNCSEMGGKYG